MNDLICECRQQTVETELVLLGRVVVVVVFIMTVLGVGPLS